MRNRNRWIAAGMVLLAVAMTLTMTNRARSQRPDPPTIPPAPAAKPVAGTVEEEIAAEAGMKVDDVKKVIRALGPNIAKRLARGEQVDFPGFGLFRVVRVPEHKDLVDGRPAVITGANYVEFLAGPTLNGAANAPTAVPAATVPPFQFIPLPGQTPGQRVPENRMPSTRIR